MKSIKLALAAAALALSTSANAAVISYGGYTHDTDTDIVTGNGLEWLQWDRTLELNIDSIQSQLNTLEGGGWSVASNTQMAQLLNAFDFGITFDNHETTEQALSTGFSTGDPGTEADELFISMFGDTRSGTAGEYCAFGECISESSSIYGLDSNGNDLFNYVVVKDDYILQSATQEAGVVFMSNDVVERIGWSHPSSGVALVRNVSPVPVPAAVWLFGSGLLGLIGVSRRKVHA